MPVNTWLNGISTCLNRFTYRALNGPWEKEWAAKAENQSLFDRVVFEANNLVFHKRSKHINIYQILREKIAEGVINLVFVSWINWQIYSLMNWPTHDSWNWCT
jgi:hypothetical protein